MKWFLIVLFFLLNGCSGLPKTMRSSSYSNLNLSTVKAKIPSYLNSSFRWGGTIINVTNEKDSSQIQILFYPISRYGQPQTNRKTEGRFAITSPKFLDPAIYKEGSKVTVTGSLTGEIKQKIGEKVLTLPLLSLDNIHLWPDNQQVNNRVYRYPYPLVYPYYYPYRRYNSYFNFCY